ncbi:MAG: isochorismatase family protein [Bryobacterales bacterium]|nr:isochorismatase family protein [Bryobacterales bacterium]
MRNLSRRALLAAACGAAFPKSTGVLRLKARRGAGETILEWKPAETAIIICDMWDNHYCRNAAKRVKAMAPRMNRVLKQARGIGVTIIHAPSGTMDVYAGAPQRLRLMNAPKMTPPVPIMKSCPLDRGREGPLPVDDVTQPCDDAVVGPAVRRYNRENELLEIASQDGISDDEEEIYSYFHQRKIRNVVLMGVHTNMCILGRSFGIRQQVRLGMNAVLARDLTDAMYDPRQRPFVSHEKGAALIISHIEKYWCPSVLSEDLTHLA